MHPVKIASIFLLLFGIAAMVIGMLIYWFTFPVSPWASVLILIGILLMIGASVLLCIAINYDLELSILKIKNKYQT